MKKSVVLLFTGIIALANIQTTKADTIAQWTFESLTLSPSLTNATSAFGIAADAGSGTASSSHASALTIFSTPVGNGSAKSLSANNWAVGDYLQFQVSTLTYSGISVSYDQISSSTGPGQFTLQYSTDGSTFTPFGSQYTVLVNASPNTWGSVTPVSASSYTYDLSSITALDNASTVYFRVVDTGTLSASQANGGATAPAASGTDRVDNFTVFTTPVPEPSTIALAGIGGVAALFALRRRK